LIEEICPGGTCEKVVQTHILIVYPFIMKNNLLDVRVELRKRLIGFVAGPKFE
jgi:poly(3-hydroxyalkanoate) synthetase